MRIKLAELTERVKALGLSEARKRYLRKKIAATLPANYPLSEAEIRRIATDAYRAGDNPFRVVASERNRRAGLPDTYENPSAQLDLPINQQNTPASVAQQPGSQSPNITQTSVQTPMSGQKPIPENLFDSPGESQPEPLASGPESLARGELYSPSPNLAQSNLDTILPPTTATQPTTTTTNTPTQSSAFNLPNVTQGDINQSRQSLSAGLSLPQQAATPKPPTATTAAAPKPPTPISTALATSPTSPTPTASPAPTPTSWTSVSGAAAMARRPRPLQNAGVWDRRNFAPRAHQYNPGATTRPQIGSDVDEYLDNYLNKPASLTTNTGVIKMNKKSNLTKQAALRILQNVRLAPEQRKLVLAKVAQVIKPETAKSFIKFALSPYMASLRGAGNTGVAPGYRGETGSPTEYLGPTAENVGTPTGPSRGNWSRARDWTNNQMRSGILTGIAAGGQVADAAGRGIRAVQDVTKPVATAGPSYGAGVTALPGARELGTNFARLPVQRQQQQVGPSPQYIDDDQYQQMRQGQHEDYRRRLAGMDAETQDRFRQFAHQRADEARGQLDPADTEAYRQGMHQARMTAMRDWRRMNREPGSVAPPQSPTPEAAPARQIATPNQPMQPSQINPRTDTGRAATPTTPTRPRHSLSRNDRNSIFGIGFRDAPQPRRTNARTRQELTQAPMPGQRPITGNPFG